MQKTELQELEIKKINLWKEYQALVKELQATVDEVLKDEIRWYIRETHQELQEIEEKVFNIINNI